MQETYRSTGLYFAPGFFSSEEVKDIQQWTEELKSVTGVELTMEKGQVTRAENFVNVHSGFAGICNNKSRIALICADLFGESKAFLCKEKLNYKVREFLHLDLCTSCGQRSYLFCSARFFEALQRFGFWGASLRFFTLKRFR